MIQIKFLLKQTISTVISKLIPVPKRRLVILCYHSIHPKKSFSSATPELFEKHLRWLKENATVIPFSKVSSLTTTESEDAEKPRVAITFDDGYVDNYEYAFPLLRKYGFVATFFVTVGLIEKDPQVVARFRYLRNNCPGEEIEPLTWDQLREMRKAGMEIGAHTWSHPNLARLTADEVEVELRRSKELMEERLGEEVDSLAYPFGKYRRHFTRETMNIAQRLGFRYGAAVAFRAVRPSDHPLALPRFFVTMDSVEILAQKVFGAWDWLGWWQEKVPLWLARLVSHRDFEV